MDALEEYLTGGKVNARPAGFPRVDPEVQKSRDVGAQKIKEQELTLERSNLANAKTDEAKRIAQSNIDSLVSEMGGKPAAKSSDILESYLTETPTEPKQSNVAAIANKTVAKKDSNLPTPDVLYEVPRALIQNTAAQIAGGYAGIAGSLLPGPAGQGARWSEKVQQKLGGYEPPSAAGKTVMNVLAAPAEYVISPTAEAVGGAVANVSPAAGAIVKGAIEAAPLALGLSKVKAKPVGVTKELAPGSEISPLDVPTVTRQQFEAKRGEAPAPRGTQTFPEMQAALEKKRLEAQGVKPAAVPAETVATVAAEAPTMKGGGAASSNLNPYPPFTGQDFGKGELFPAIKSSLIAGDVPKNEQALRAQIASEITKSNQVRTGVMTGNEDILRSEHTESASPNPSVKGQLLKSQIANEQKGLTNFAEERIKATGASENLINETQRGERINDVFYGKQEAGEAPTTLQSYLDQAKKQVYDSARQIHGDKPTLSTNFNKLINDEQWQAGLSLNEKQGIAATAQKFMNLADTKGFKDINGVLQPAGSVSAKDAVRKALNKKWTHENANVIREMNQAIDMDIAAVADPKLYKLGDRIHQAEKNIYDTKGIKKLFGEVDEKGIVRSKTAFDKVTSTLNDLPVDEWKHIRSTLDDLSKGVVRNAPEGMPPVPDSLRQSAAAAVKEIDGALAREVYRAGAKDQGVWNQNRATNVLNSRVGEKIHETFSPDEVSNFQKLNAGGHIMPGKHNYEGAALQTERVKNIFERNLAGIGATAGSSILTAIAGPGVGTAVGGYVGGHFGAKGSAALEAKALQKAATKLQDEMRRNAKLGTELKNVGKKKKD